MRSQVRFAMHPADERDFELMLVREESIHFIPGPRWSLEKRYGNLRKYIRKKNSNSVI